LVERAVDEDSVDKLRRAGCHRRRVYRFGWEECDPAAAGNATWKAIAPRPEAVVEARILTTLLFSPLEISARNRSATARAFTR